MLLWSPERFGWELAGGFETMLFVEIGIVIAAMFVLPGMGEPLAVPSGALICLILGVGLGVYAGPLVAVLVPGHFMARMAVSWRQPSQTRRLVRHFSLSFVALALAWFAAGLFWAHEGAWSADIVPQRLWWEVPSPNGIRRIPQAVPIFGAVYFSLLTGIELAGVLARWFFDEVQLKDVETAG